jgi:hypothetical protein
MGIVEVAVVGVDRVPQLPEGAGPLARGRLGGGVQGRCPRPLRRQGEVADADPQGQGLDPRPLGGAVGAGEIEVEDRLGALTSNVVVGADRRYGRAA